MKKGIPASLTFGTLAASVLLFLSGCASSGPERTAASPPVKLESAHPKNTDVAVKHFINGSLLESNKELLQAFEEYRVALEFDENASILSALSRVSLALNRRDAALQYMLRAVRLSPENSNFREQLAELYMQTGNRDSATSQYETVIRLDPSNVDARFILATLYQDVDPIRALELYESVRDRVGSDADLLFQIAEAYTSLGRYDDAIETLESMRSLEPDNEALLETLAGLYLHSRKSEDALGVYADLREKYPGEVRYAISSAGVLKDLGRWDEARDVLRTILDSDSIATEEAMAVGEVFFQQAIVDSSTSADAISMYDTLSRRYPEDWHSFWFRGATNFNIGRLRNAVPDFLAVIRLNPSNVETHEALARAYLALEDYESSIKPLQTLIDRKAATAETYSYLGFALSKLGKSKLAITALEKALALDPRRMDALSTLALTYDDKKQFDRSDALYESALRAYEQDSVLKDANYFLLLNNFAYTLSERGIQLDRAMEMARKALEYEDENSSYLDTMGWIYFKSGKPDQALEYIRRAIDVKKRNSQSPGPVLYEHLGDVYQNLGNRDDALKYWNEALLENPNNPDVQNKIRRLTP